MWKSQGIRAGSIEERHYFSYPLSFNGGVSLTFMINYPKNETASIYEMSRLIPDFYKPKNMDLSRLTNSERCRSCRKKFVPQIDFDS